MDATLFPRVVTLVARETGSRPERIRPETLVEDDLGCTGDDAAELMAEFAREFGVDLTGFQFSRHFGAEAPATPWSLLRGLVVWLATGRTGEPSPDPVTVARLVDAAARGRWADSGEAAT